MEDFQRFIEEDVGRGDITSQALFKHERAKGVVFSRQKCIVAGLAEAEGIFNKLNLKTEALTRDGAQIKSGTKVLEIEGNIVNILKGERVALNFLMRMSGIATETKKLVDKCKKAKVRVVIAGTRKTVPGFRKYDKKAIEIGGGWPHRMDLHDGILIKDNHLKLISIAEAVRRTKFSGKRVEIEATNAKQALEAAKVGAHIVMLDNMSSRKTRTVSKMLRKSYPKVKIEISGGITPRNVLRYAPYADIISLGYLTHSSKAANFSLEIEPQLEDQQKKRRRRRLRKT